MDNELHSEQEDFEQLQDLEQNNLREAEEDQRVPEEYDEELPADSHVEDHGQEGMDKTVNELNHQNYGN